MGYPAQTYDGISVKSLKTFLGHEGETCAQGDLYLGTKKIASWSQDGKDAIMDRVSMEDGLSEKKLRDAIIGRNKDREVKVTSYDKKEFTIPYDLENLMEDLLLMKEAEKDFKRALKAGCNGIDRISNESEVLWSLEKQNVLDLPEEKLKERFRYEIQKLKKSSSQKGKEPELRVFRSKEDFDTGDKIRIEEIFLDGSNA